MGFLVRREHNRQHKFWANLTIFWIWSSGGRYKQINVGVSSSSNGKWWYTLTDLWCSRQFQTLSFLYLIELLHTYYHNNLWILYFVSFLIFIIYFVVNCLQAMMDNFYRTNDLNILPSLALLSLSRFLSLALRLRFY